MFTYKVFCRGHIFYQPLNCKALKIKKILVSQPAPENDKSPYYDIAEKYNVKIEFRPFIKVEPLPLKDFRQQRISILEHTAVIFTARTAIDHFFSICEELRITVPETMKYFCVTETIANYLQKFIDYRKRKVFFPKTGKQEDIIIPVTKHKTEKFLLVVSDVHTDKFVSLLEKNTIQYTKGVFYRTVSNYFSPEEAFDYDMLLFFSPAGVDSLFKNFPNYQQGEVYIGCFGSTTALAVKNAGLRLDVEAPTKESPSMTSALDAFLKEKAKMNGKK